MKLKTVNTATHAVVRTLEIRGATVQNGHFGSMWLRYRLKFIFQKYVLSYTYLKNMNWVVDSSFLFYNNPMSCRFKSYIEKKGFFPTHPIWKGLFGALDPRTDANFPTCAFGVRDLHFDIFGLTSAKKKHTLIRSWAHTVGAVQIWVILQAATWHSLPLHQQGTTPKIYILRHECHCAERVACPHKQDDFISVLDICATVLCNAPYCTLWICEQSLSLIFSEIWSYALRQLKNHCENINVYAAQF